MIILRDLLLWAVVCIHIVGAAFAFRRLFPLESRWLAFIVPELVLILICNFVEHHLALTYLRLLLPVTTAASVTVMFAWKSQWRFMRMPTFLFVGSFALTMLLRAVMPDISDDRDGITDLSLMCDFMSGQTLPTESTWLPPVKLEYYYFLEHYAASVVTRLLGIDVGTGFNLSCALLSAYVLFLAGGTAWLIGRGRLWVTILMPILTGCSATGLNGYLWLTMKDVDSEGVINPHSLLGRPDAAANWFMQKLTPVYVSHEPVLTPPGFGAWVGSFHSVQAGQFVVCLAVLALVEVLRRKRTNWPWICLALSPFLMLTTCTWSVPMIGFIIVAALVVCVRAKIKPRSPRFVVAASAGLVALLEPMLQYFLNWAPWGDFGFVEEGYHTQWPEFLGQWWPVYLPWLGMLLVWKRLSAATRIVVLVVPLCLIAVEIWSFGWRGDMTAKTWGCIFTAGWIVFLPELANQRPWPFRLLLVYIGAACVLSLCCWVAFDWRSLKPDELGHLDGKGAFRLDDRKARILEVVSRYENQVILPSVQDGVDQGAGLIPLFSHTRAYATWTLVSDIIFYSNGMSESGRRLAGVNLLYQGKLANPLYYLRQRNIAAVVIYPDDNIDASIVEKLTRQLAPYYTYEDAYTHPNDQPEMEIAPNRPCAGVFVYHPEIAAFLGPPKDTGPK